MGRREHPQLLSPRDTVLLVVDVQERFRPAMDGFEVMLAGCIRLVRTFRSLELPVLVTEQYPQGLGRTVPELLDALGADEPREKTGFSCLSCRGLQERLEGLGARSVVVAGIETHVCVLQTTFDLMAAGYEVHVAVDAVQSRRPQDRAVALERMARSGAVLSTTEMSAFELLRDARHPRFKEVQRLFL